MPQNVLTRSGQMGTRWWSSLCSCYQWTENTTSNCFACSLFRSRLSVYCTANAHWITRCFAACWEEEEPTNNSTVCRIPCPLHAIKGMGRREMKSAEHPVRGVDRYRNTVESGACSSSSFYVLFQLPAIFKRFSTRSVKRAEARATAWVSGRTAQQIAAAILFLFAAALAAS